MAIIVDVPNDVDEKRLFVMPRLTDIDDMHPRQARTPIRPVHM
jgi:hypothetical protein